MKTIPLTSKPFFMKSLKEPKPVYLPGLLTRNHWRRRFNGRLKIIKDFYRPSRTARWFLLEKSLIFGYSEAHVNQKIGVSSNGRTTGSGPVYLGSSPGAPATLSAVRSLREH